MREIQRDIVAAMIFSKDGRLFQGTKHPKKGGVYLDCWHIPGGGIKEGEEKQEALIREIKEETGIDVSAYDLELIDDQGVGESEKTLSDGEKVLCKMKFYVYKVIIDDKEAGEIQVSLDDDLEKYKWSSLDELKILKLTPPSISLFKRLGYL